MSVAVPEIATSDGTRTGGARGSFDAMPDSPRTENAGSGGTATSQGGSSGSRRDLSIGREARIEFPARVTAGEPARMGISFVRKRTDIAESGLTLAEWPLQVYVDLVNVQPEDFLVEGRHGGIIEVPRSRDSDALVFILTGQTPGKKEVPVRFELDNNYLGTALVHTEVVAPGQAESLGREARPGERVEPGAGLPGWAPETEPAQVEYPPSFQELNVATDIVIYVNRRHRNALASDREFTVHVRLPGDPKGEPPRAVDRIFFDRSPEAYVRRHFESLEPQQEALPAHVVKARITTIGNSIYKTVLHDHAGLEELGFPELPGFKDYYSGVLAAFPLGQGLQLITEDPYLPWEIMRPYWRVNGVWTSGEYHLCERFAMARWPTYRKKPAGSEHVPLGASTIVAPHSGLAHAPEEREQVSKILGPVTEIITNWDELDDFFRNGRANVVHFICHGVFDPQNPDRSAILIDRKGKWHPYMLSGEYENVGLSSPLVFVNACHSARTGLGLTGVEGWAEAFIGVGARCFIGPLWAARDDAACVFATWFYRYLTNGTSLREAMRQARAEAAATGGATYLSYCLYAFPGQDDALKPGLSPMMAGEGR